VAAGFAGRTVSVVMDSRVRQALTLLAEPAVQRSTAESMTGDTRPFAG
jgi:hypothetical protein